MRTHTCQQCHQSFQTSPSRTPKFCSFPCRVAAQTHEVKRPGKHSRICQECSKPFYIYPASPQRFCKRVCRSAYDRRPEVVAQRFWSHYDRSGDCWLWTGGTVAEGYGKYTVTLTTGPKTFLAHRFAWVLANNALIPQGMNVCHSCDIRPCGKPDHLFLGTQQDNIRDMFTKGRNSFHLPDGTFWVPK